LMIDTINVKLICGLVFVRFDAANVVWHLEGV
jgi:hypothetical protein